ncbi:MAG TPA: GNAT family N-acetyltransferase [Anaerolineales bacterium]|nr:GNAT family N-acetyltransferase [Anaerolineales bacterium]
MNTTAPIESTAHVSIEPASIRDLAALRNVEKVCFPKDAWPLMDLIGVLTFSAVIRLKAVNGKEMVGFIAGDIRRLEGVAWIATVAVLPEYRGRGIGSALLQACEDKISLNRIRLCVRVSNDSAIHLYEQRGYERVGEWSRYYQDGESALVMEKRK